MILLVDTQWVVAKLSPFKISYTKPHLGSSAYKLVIGINFIYFPLNDHIIYNPIQLKCYYEKLKK